MVHSLLFVWPAASRRGIGKSNKVKVESFELIGLKYCLSIELQKPYHNGPKLDNIRGGIIADEMGLGKTILAASVLLATIDIREPIVILNKSLTNNFSSNIKKLLETYPGDKFTHPGTKQVFLLIFSLLIEESVRDSSIKREQST